MSRTLYFLLVLAHLPSTAAFAEDTVWMKSSGPSDRVYKRVGTVNDYTGETLTLAPDTRIPADRVVRIDSDWTEAQQVGDKAFAAGDFEKSLTAYGQALRDEPRGWVRRQIMTQMVWCYRGLGKSDLAALAFVSLIKADPTSRSFDAIPLVWNSSATKRVDTAKARDWLSDENAAARLVGASHLLSTPDHRAAMEVLEALSIIKDPRVALLAQAHLWRVRTAQSKLPEVEGWADAIERVPESLRAGPYFVVARAFAQHKQARRAAEMYMRVSILHRKQYHLAAQALWDAARQLESLGGKDRARRLYREIVRDFGESPLVEPARRKIAESDESATTP